MVQAMKKRPTYRAKVTGRHAITLPAKLCRSLNIEVGDTVELEEIGGQALLRPASEVPERTIGTARGILRDYFRDWEDVQQFIEEERAGWDERERRLDEVWQRAQRPGKQSDTSAAERLSKTPQSQ